MHVLSGVLRKAPFYKQLDGDKGHMWAVELSEVNKNRDTQQNEYTNYKALLFAKAQGQAQFYNDNLVQGAFVVVSCEKLTIQKSFGQNNQEYITLQMENSRLDNVNNPNQQQAQPQGGLNQQQPQQNQGGFNQAQPQQNQSGFNQQQQPQQSQGAFNQQQPQQNQGGFNQAQPQQNQSGFNQQQQPQQSQGAFNQQQPQQNQGGFNQQQQVQPQRPEGDYMSPPK